MTTDLSENITKIQNKIAKAAERSGRSPDQIKLLAATKTRNVKEILAAKHAGIELIGENRVQEALSKFEFLPPTLEKHMIGSLQPNKVRQAVRLFDLIQSVNSIELANSIDEACREIGKVIPVLVEVNVAQESSKRGAALSQIGQLIAHIVKLENIELRGLMAMAPYLKNPEALRPIFREMKLMFEQLRENDGSIDTLSMGMSNDYEIAIEEGSTLVRLGTTIFGARAK